MKTWLAEVGKDQKEDPSTWIPQKKFTRAEVKNADGNLNLESDGSWLFSGQNVAKPIYEIEFSPGKSSTITAIRLDAIPHPEFGKPRQLARSVNGNFVLTDVKISAVDEASGKSRPLGFSRAVASFEQDNYPISQAIDSNPGSGWAVFGKGVGPETVSAYFVLDAPAQLAASERLEMHLAHQSQYANHNIGRFKIFLSESEFKTTPDKKSLPPKVRKALKTPEKRRSPAERKTLTDFYRTIDQPLKQAQRNLKQKEAALAKLGAAAVPVMVMREREGERLPAYLLDRGQYDAPDRSEELRRAVPAAFFEGDEEDQPKDRLELARWIVSEENPLTARVIVNRIWQDHFGTGLVKTVEDFGAQSELPSHPELLDWLAVRFMKSGWDLKALHRLIVASATYQQRTMADPTLYNRDPENRLLARGPRYRLDGFAIRDLALQASGLLNRRLGGAPVKPYQPEGLWNSVAGRSSIRYNPATGDDLYRKSLYTYWKRAVNPPRQLIFDAGGREACNVAVRRTNTPLQALVLMTDDTFIEAARHLAEDVIQENSETDPRLRAIFRKVTSLKATEKQLKMMRGNLTFFEKHFGKRPTEAADFLKAGQSPRDESIDAREHAAWTAVAHLVLNLDTSMTVQ